jgi:glycosyltransferase involved in cell wall biosynthesis
MYTRVFSGFRIDPFVNATNDLELRRSLGFGADQFVIGKIARLAPLKGHEDLLNAFQALLPGCPQARLLLVGDGPQGAEIRQLARRFGLMERVVFTGLVPPLEVARYVGIMDCLAHLSSREALSRALPQALAGGKPVVSYDFDGADEVCLEGQTGFLVRTGDVAGVVRALQELAGKPDLRRQLGQQGQSFVQQHFKVEKMVDDLYELYLKLLSQHG